jgi:hypothetical protein
MRPSAFTNAVRQANRNVLADQALRALEASTGIIGRKSGTFDEDGQLVLTVGAHSMQMEANVVSSLRKNAEVHHLVQTGDGTQLVIAPQVSHEMALSCRANGVQFIDTTGNAYLNPPHQPGVYVFVAGLKPSEGMELPKPDSITSQSGLRLILALLSDPTLLDQPYRDIADTAQIALGSVSAAMKALEARGFISQAAQGRILQRKTELAGEWVAGYSNRLYPKLMSMRFGLPPGLSFKEISFEPGKAAWGGEVAAAIMTNYLKPETMTLFTDISDIGFVSDLVRRHRLRSDPNGAIELVQPFWDMHRIGGPQSCAPLLVVYADLLRSGDPRNMEAAKMVLDLIVADHA